MKKKLFFLAVAAATLASCSNDQVVSENTTTNQPKEITISPFSKPATRSLTDHQTAAIDGVTYPDNLPMQVAAYAMPITSSWAAGGYFDKTEFTGTNETNWSGTTKRYWPLTDAYVSFLAVAGVDAADVTSMNTVGGTAYASGATVSYDAEAFANQTDLMYSAKQEQVIQAGNALSFPDDVDMTFQHALAWLQFNVGVPSGAAYGDVIDIRSIVVNGAYQTGTYTITNTGYDTAGDPTPTGVWSNFSAATATTVPGSDYSSTLPNDGTYAACGKVLLVPQASPNTSFTSFTINYQMNGKDYAFTFTPASTVLAQDTKYIYNIKFTLTEILIDPVVEDWQNGGSTLIEIPAQITAGTPYTINIPSTAGAYTFNISGFTGSSVAAAATSGTFSTAPAATLSGSVSTVTFGVEANAIASPVNRTITVTETGGSATSTVITIVQAAGAGG